MSEETNTRQPTTVTTPSDTEIRIEREVDAPARSSTRHTPIPS